MKEKSKLWLPIEKSWPAGTSFTNAIRGLSGPRLSDSPIRAATTSGYTTSSATSNGERARMRRSFASRCHRASRGSQ